MPTTIHDILEIFRAEAFHKRDLGDKFERLVAAYLTKEPYYAGLFGNKVWLWKEWPGRGNMPDTGIDVVAEEIATGDVWAIQCKFNESDSTLYKAHLDSFFSTSGKEPFRRRLIVATTDKWSKNLVDLCKDQQIPVSTLNLQELGDSAVDWSDFKLSRPDQLKLKTKKFLRPHQKTALADVQAGLAKADRGKLIMACGTGKTFTALKIVETIVPDGGNVLFLVPSISLIQQSLTEWAAQSEMPLNCFAVCSDPKVGRNEEEDISTHDLAFPAHTNPRLLVKQIKARATLKKTNINVIFSTYQSIAVVAEAQSFGLPKFDLIVCDEAHRTTGVEQTEYSGKEASAFVSVHKEDFIKAKKRLYMTATPRIYDDASKGKAKDADVQLYSMDDPAIYGAELHRLDFSEAVRKDLLSDYKVMVLAVDESFIDRNFQRIIADKNNELKAPDVVKIVGCYNGLKKRFIKPDGKGAETPDANPMRRAVAFSTSIKYSKMFTDLFEGVIKQYPGDKNSDADATEESNPDFLQCQVAHVDGKMNALERSHKLQWLKADTARDGNICRILSNARCLSEGVDVPALDAVMFLNPRNSVVDVVQSVGRVMRKAPGKQYGYIILPIGVPADVPPEKALADNEKYKVVWQVLQALRAHDDRFNAIINKIELNNERPKNIEIIGVGGGSGDGELNDKPKQGYLAFPHLEDWENKIFAKIVLKCGSRRYWEQWAQDVAKIAERHIARIRTLLGSADAKFRQQFDKFLNGLRKTLNPSISEDDAIEMLAQHLITKPVFDALFEGYEFTKHNPVSKTMQKMLDLLEEQALDKETETLEKFYESVRERARGIDNAEGKQRIIVELYDKFFKTAFPRMAERLGIVYTPIEVVDFILRSADDALKSEFGVGLTDKNVHVLDPFTGTGTFIVRLLQSGIIEDKDLTRKFRDELHANEIILLAYYIAAINIEEAYHGRAKKDYEPFEGIVLTDTFQLSEGEGTFADESFQANSERAQKQNKRDIRVIVGNPPYSAQQESENDSNKNLKYPDLDSRIRNSYAAASNAGLQKNLYDSYIRSIRWASNRVKDKGIICFVSNGSFIDGNAMDGLRKCLVEEFAAIYCFNLRGNQRTSGELSRMEGGKIFGSGSRAPIAITLLVKDSGRKAPGQLFYHDIGDYLSREEKLNIITEFQGIRGVPWHKITPNNSHDWIDQRDPAFEKFIALGDKDDPNKPTIFDNYSLGVVTNRDAWAYNFSKASLLANMGRMIGFYKDQVESFKKLPNRSQNISIQERQKLVEGFIDTDAKKISWTRAVKNSLGRMAILEFRKDAPIRAAYRPFAKQWLYYDKHFNEMLYQMPRIFPNGETDNLVISVTGRGATKDFCAFISNALPDLEMISKGQCFPLRYREEPEKSDEKQKDLLAAQGGWRENVSDFALKQFRAGYKDAKIQKEDIFYYVYGILHSPEYKTRFAADLKKMLPRIPLAEDFWAFSRAGRALADIHLNYESAQPYPVKESRDVLELKDENFYRVEKMRFGKTAKTATTAAEVDKSTIIYNSHITLTGIPLAAYEYVVNGKPAIEWIMDRYQISRDKDSGILNDPNDWAREHDDPKYILNLLKSIITVSLETMKIVKGLPELREEEVRQRTEKFKSL